VKLGHLLLAAALTARSVYGVNLHTKLPCLPYLNLKKPGKAIKTSPRRKERGTSEKNNDRSIFLGCCMAEDIPFISGGHHGMFITVIVGTELT
jgi:hypothetical protein